MRGQRVFALLEHEDTEMDRIETIAVNLSGQSLGDRAFYRDVIRMVRAATFDARKLCFEVTETAAITNLADAKLFIDEVELSPRQYRGPMSLRSGKSRRRQLCRRIRMRGYPRVAQ